MYFRTAVLGVVSAAAVALVAVGPANAAPGAAPRTLLDGPACHGQVVGSLASEGFGTPSQTSTFEAGDWNKFLRSLCVAVQGS
jgi:hypothetical protein